MQRRHEWRVQRRAKGQREEVQALVVDHVDGPGEEVDDSRGEGRVVAQEVGLGQLGVERGHGTEVGQTAIGDELVGDTGVAARGRVHPHVVSELAQSARQQRSVRLLATGIGLGDGVTRGGEHGDAH